MQVVFFVRQTKLFNLFQQLFACWVGSGVCDGAGVYLGGSVAVRNDGVGVDAGPQDVKLQAIKIRIIVVVINGFCMGNGQ